MERVSLSLSLSLEREEDRNAFFNTLVFAQATFSKNSSRCYKRCPSTRPPAYSGGSGSSVTATSAATSESAGVLFVSSLLPPEHEPRLPSRASSSRDPNQRHITGADICAGRRARSPPSSREDITPLPGGALQNHRHPLRALSLTSARPVSNV